MGFSGAFPGAEIENTSYNYGETGVFCKKTAYELEKEGRHLFIYAYKQVRYIIVQGKKKQAEGGSLFFLKY